jgi:hypothetical protein
MESAAMFKRNSHDCAPVVNNAHVVAYYKAMVGEWNAYKFREATPPNREAFNQIILGNLNLYRLEQMRGRMTANDMCRKCGDIAIDNQLCLICED